MKIKNITSGLLFIGVILLVSHSFAQVPQLINFQGVLTDPGTGTRLSGTYSITFSIYSDSTGGTSLWSETQNVTVQDGLFNVLLGSVTAIPFDLFDGTDKYLGVTVGNDAEMTPRKKLVSVGYSFRAYHADKVDGKDATAFIQVNQPNSISTDMLQNDAVTISKISPRIVSSIDGVVHDGADIDLVAGDNITITPDDQNNRITISAVAGAGDNLGNHTATQNIKLGDYWLSGDGDDEGLKISESGAIHIANSWGYATLGLGKYDFLGDRIKLEILDGEGSQTTIGLSLNVDNNIMLTYAYLAGSVGVYGANDYDGAQTLGYIAGSDYGVYGTGGRGGRGYIAGEYGVFGEHIFGNYGYIGGMEKAVYGKQGEDGQWAGYFDGDAHVTGTLTKGAGAFLIDHPLDPANKYLAHSFVESPDMKNIYDGVATLDANGEAIVELPQWFQALNKDFRYQLTCIGSFAQVYIAEKISNNRFKIAGGKPGMEISWQVTGIRKDAFANAHRIQVEWEKEDSDRGKYLHPQEHGLPESMGMDYDQQLTIENEQARMEASIQKINEERQKEIETRKQEMLGNKKR